MSSRSTRRADARGLATRLCQTLRALDNALRIIIRLLVGTYAPHNKRIKSMLTSVRLARESGSLTPQIPPIFPFMWY